MPFNPLANVVQLLGNPLEPKNDYDRKDSEAIQRTILNNYKQLAIITSVDTDSVDRYFIDVYSPLYLTSSTAAGSPVRQDVIAHASSPYDVYEEGDLIRVIMLANGTAIIISEHVRQPVIVTTAGPSGEADFTGNQYWGKLAFCSNAGGDPTTVFALTAYPSPLDKIISFTNINEDSSSHGDLVDGDYAYVDWEYDLSSPTKRNWARDASVGIKSIRINTTTKELQYTFSKSPADADWINFAGITPCTPP